MGYGADPTIADERNSAPLHFVLAKKAMDPLSAWTLHLNKVHIHIDYCGLLYHNNYIDSFLMANRSMSMYQELTTVFRWSLSTSLWPVSWSVKEQVWRL